MTAGKHPCEGRSDEAILSAPADRPFDLVIFNCDGVLTAIGFSGDSLAIPATIRGSWRRKRRSSSNRWSAAADPGRWRAVTRSDRNAAVSVYRLAPSVVPPNASSG